MAISQMIGARIHRREDPHLITGGGRYVEDLIRPGTLCMAVVRSPHAHARITRINTANAKSLPGVVAVLTAADFKTVIPGPTHPSAPAFVAEKRTVPDRFPIADQEACFEGEPVAVVVAENRKLAFDGAAAVEVEYEPLPVVMDLEKALQSGSPKTHTNLVDNVAWDFTYSPEDAVKAAFDQAEIVVKERILQQRLAPVPIEPRGVIAEFDRFDDQLTLWVSTQNPHLLRLWVSMALGMPETKIRVISRDVGGGFGSKVCAYPEDYLVAAASKLVNRAVRWTETRTE